MTGRAELEPFLGKAKAIPSGYAKEFDCIARSLRVAIDSEEERIMQRLPTGTVGVLLLGEPQLLQCLSSSSAPTG